MAGAKEHPLRLPKLSHVVTKKDIVTTMYNAGISYEETAEHVISPTYRIVGDTEEDRKRSLRAIAVTEVLLTHKHIPIDEVESVFVYKSIRPDGTDHYDVKRNHVRADDFVEKDMLHDPYHVIGMDNGEMLSDI